MPISSRFIVVQGRSPGRLASCAMSVRLTHDTSFLADAVHRNMDDNVDFADDEVSSLGGASIHTASLLGFDGRLFR